MKRFLICLMALAAVLAAAPSCIEDEYDLDREVDKTIELKNFTVALGETFKVEAKDFLGKNWLGKIANLLVNWEKTFDFGVNGEVGTFDIDGIADDITSEYKFSHAIVTMTLETNLPCGFKINAKALDESGNEIDGITATCEPEYIFDSAYGQITESGAVKTQTGVRVEVKSADGSDIEFDGVRLDLYSTKQSVTIKKSHYIKGYDIVVSFPEGVIKVDMDK